MFCATKIKCLEFSESHHNWCSYSCDCNFTNWKFPYIWTCTALLHLLLITDLYTRHLLTSNTNWSAWFEDKHG